MKRDELTMSGAPLGPREQVLRLLAGKWVVAALSAAADIGLADALLAGPKSNATLAVELGCHEPSLERLLKVLAGEGIIEETTTDHYGLTEMGRHLRSDELGPLLEYVGSPMQWAPWANLAHSVRTGEAAFDATHGASLYDYLAQHPEDSEKYDRGVDVFTREQARNLAEKYDFSTTERVIDVGGGRGSVLVELLARWPDLHGVLFDLDFVVAEPHPRLTGEFAERNERVAGDFREAVPPGADCYVVKHVLHNWDDDQSVAILNTCAAAMAPGGRILVIEGLLLPGSWRDPTRLLDLEMLVVLQGARERRKPEFRRLFKRAGLKLARSFRLTDTAWCMEVVMSGDNP